MPALSWESMKETTDPDPATTRQLQADVQRLAAGDPDLGRYTADTADLVREAAKSFASAGGSPLFANLKLHLLERGQQDSRRVLYYLADFDSLSLYLRITLADDGRIARVQITQG